MTFAGTSANGQDAPIPVVEIPVVTEQLTGSGRSASGAFRLIVISFAGIRTGAPAGLPLRRDLGVADIERQLPSQNPADIFDRRWRHGFRRFLRMSDLMRRQD